MLAEWKKQLEEIFKEEDVIPLLPKFLQEEKELTGASRGTAYHKLLELLDFSKDYDADTLASTIATFVSEGLLSEEMAACICIDDILAFLGSAIGKRVQAAGRRGTYHAEQPFVMGFEAREIYKDTDAKECVLVQGIVDVYFEEDGELVVLDYKTDKVRNPSELAERYHTQLDYYAKALGELTGKLMETMASAFNVDEEKIASAFKFDMSEDEIRRLFETMSSTAVENADTNLLSLGYQNLEEPTSISFYFKDFDSKEMFKEFIKEYNEKMEKEDEDKVINYTDITGILMSSVKTIVDSVSYVLIAFVSISLIVSSIMIGIITYISVLERTKEIGVLRAIGASKRNISSIFNAETFIVGLFSGVLGILTTIGLLIPTNLIIHSVNSDISAVLPIKAAIVLVILSVILTLIGGLIPSRQAAKKDPVLALRSE